MQTTLKTLSAAIVILSLVFVGCETMSSPPTSTPLDSSPPTTQSSKGHPDIVFDFDGQQQSDGLPSPWKSRVIRGDLGISLEVDPELAGHHALKINCIHSHFLIYNQDKPFDPRQFPILTWSWKAAVLPTNADVRTHDSFYYSSNNRNDKVLQILVGFEGDRVINYSWDTTAPVGTCVDEWSPAAKVKTYIIESGSQHLGSWHEEKVNILADYQKLYGSPVAKVIGISVQTNSNHTSSCSAGFVGPIHAGAAGS